MDICPKYRNRNAAARTVLRVRLDIDLHRDMGNAKPRSTDALLHYACSTLLSLAA